MSKEPHWCPVCDFGGGATLASVRGHFNAATSEDHEWERLREQVENQQAEPAREQGEPDENAASWQPESSENDGSTDGPDGGEEEQGGEQTEGGENAPSGQAESGSEMATQDEYERQQQGQQAETSDEGGEKGTPSGGSATETDPSATATEGSGFRVPSVGGKTWLLLAGMVLVAFVAWRVLGGDDVDYEDPEEEADADESSDQMVDTDAGTGGVVP